jgi:hypothetical protein
MTGIGITPYRAMRAEDIRDLQSRTRHACGGVMPAAYSASVSAV